MGFTSWDELYRRLLDDLADNSWRTQKYVLGDRERTFSSFREFQSVLEYVRYQAQVESGEVQGRTVVRG
jgi:hypothetical protein